jgi:hypothetical protein
MEGRGEEVRFRPYDISCKIHVGDESVTIQTVK